VGTISADPDGAGPLTNRARRITYAATGLVAQQENGTTAGQSDSAWAAFAPAEAINFSYDSRRRPVLQTLNSGGTIYALTQTSYRADDRVECVAQRMNPAAFSSLPASACTLGTQGSFGPDRITKAVYDNEGQLTQVRVAVGTADEAAERTLTYTDNGQLASLKDGENNLTSYAFDGHDRPWKTFFPVTTKGAATSSTSDYEQFTYDPNGNVTSLRLRDGQAIATGYDALNRPTSKDLPGAEWDEGFGYDLLDRMTSAAKGPIPHSFAYDALGRQVAEGEIYGGVSRQFDLAGRLTRLTWQDGFFVDYDRLITGELSRVRENGATSGVGVLAIYVYDDLGRRTTLMRGNGTVTSYGYDPVSRLSAVIHDLAGTANDLTVTYSYNPASQIVSQTRSNDAYAFTGHVGGSTDSTANGLNQLASIGGGAPGYDARGNLTYDPITGRYFGYWSEGELVAASGGYGFGRDAFSRLIDTYANGFVGERFVYDGAEIVAETDGANIAGRYVRGDGPDELLAAYLTADPSSRRWVHADERGSVIAYTDSAGNATAINRYDEFGIPQTGNWGRFQYTGQLWLPQAGLYDYKFRAYDPRQGRFYQPDPIGYAGDGPNLYAYVLNDPVNFTDPLGLQVINCLGWPGCPSNWVVTGARTGGLNGAGTSGGGIYTLLPSFISRSPAIGAAAVASNKRKDRSRTCAGPVATYSRGGSLTLVGFAGFNANVSVALSYPLHPDLKNPLRGIQISFNAQAAYIQGFGFFGGSGLQTAYGFSTQHAPAGLSSSTFAYAEGDFGFGEAVGASAQASSTGFTGAAGRIQEGFGAFLGAGIGKQFTYAFKPWFC
jgi:RHS repeat-associated protein